MDIGPSTCQNLVVERLAIPVVVYAAKSTADSHGSIPTQLADCRALAEREGWEVVGEYSDEAASAYTGNRGPNLERAMEHAARLAPCALVVQHSDRLARGDGGLARHLVEIVLWARKANVTLRSVQDPQTFDGMGLVYAALMGDRNHEDSKRKSAATRAGKTRQFERGERLGGPVPDGLMRVVELDEHGRSHSRVERDPDRAPIVERAFGMSADGIGDTSIAKRLNADGHRTKAGGPWTRRRVQSLLTNPTYAARVAHDGRITDATNVTALVDPTRFDAIQAGRVKRDRGGRKTSPGRPAVRYILTRLARCDRCGSTMYCQTSPYRRKDGTHARQYVCSQVHNQTGMCDAPKIDAAKVDTAIVAHLRTLFVDFTAWTSTIKEAQTAERDGLTQQLDDARRRLARLVRAETAAHDKLVDALASNGALADTYAQALERVKVERGQLTANVEDMAHVLSARSAEPPPMDAMLDFWTRLGAAVRGGVDGGQSVEEVNLRLRDLFVGFRLGVVDGKELVGILPVLREDVVERYADAPAVAHGPDGRKAAPDLPAASPLVLFAAGVPPARPVTFDQNEPYPQA